MRYRYRTYLLTLLSLIVFKANAITSLSAEVQGEELSIDRYVSKGDQLVLFISAGIGLPERISQISAGVADLGIEFWQIDLAENLFLPKSTSTFRALDGSFVAGLIEKAHELTGKNVAVMAHAYASLPVLRGVRKWQVLVFPSTFVIAPDGKIVYGVKGGDTLGHARDSGTDQGVDG